MSLSDTEGILILGSDINRSIDWVSEWVSDWLNSVSKMYNCNLNLKLVSDQKAIIEGFCAKRAYMAFWADYYFLQDRANFWQTDLFWHEKHRCVIDLRFVFKK